MTDTSKNIYACNCGPDFMENAFYDFMVSCFLSFTMSTDLVEMGFHALFASPCQNAFIATQLHEYESCYVYDIVWYVFIVTSGRC